MSHSRISTALAERSYSALKSGVKWGFIGACSGATLGSMSLASIYNDNVEARAACISNACAQYNCTTIVVDSSNQRHAIGISCSDSQTQHLAESQAKACITHAKQAVVANAAPLTMLISTLAGFGLGFFAGARYGWKKALDNLPESETNMEEDIELAYQPIP